MPIAARDNGVNTRTDGHAYTSGGEHEYSFERQKSKQKERRKYGGTQRAVRSLKLVHVALTRMLLRVFSAEPMRSVHSIVVIRNVEKPDFLVRYEDVLLHS